MNTLLSKKEIEVPCTNLRKKLTNEKSLAALFMNGQTLKKIRSSNPNHELVPIDESYTELYLSLAHSLVLKEDWFLNRCLINSNHGLRHLQRTSYFAFVLAKQLQLSNKQVLCAVIVGLLHDIRRPVFLGQDDSNENSLLWFDSNIVKISSEWGLSLRKSFYKNISTAIELCNIPYSDFTAGQQMKYSRCYKLVDILKTADTLDRYRLPNFNGIFSNRTLKLLPDPSTKQLAFDLVMLSETFALQERDDFLNVLRAINANKMNYRNLKYQWSSATFKLNTPKIGG